jgi:L-fucose isomerase-like protein
MNMSRPTVALVCIARPTFDVPLAQRMADQAAARLAEQFTLVGSAASLVMDAAAVESAISVLADAPFDLLVLFQASFADSSMAVQLAECAAAQHAPVLLWSVPDDRDGGRLRLNSLCGINLAGHALMLRQIPYDYVHCPVEDPAAIAQAARLARVGRARRLLHGATVGLVGERPGGFETCDYAASDLAALFGVEVQPIALAETLHKAANADAAARQPFLDAVARMMPNLAELDATAVAGTAGVYTTLRAEVNARNLSGVAVRCWPEFFTELGCAACGAMSMLGEEGCPASCEADVNGTVTTLLLQHLAGAPAFLTDLVSIDAASDTGVLWHCGLAPSSMADPAVGVRGTVHSNRKLPLLFEFPLKPGRVTLARLHRRSLAGGVDGYQLAIGGGEMVQAPRSFGGANGVIRFDCPAATLLDRVMRAGLEHHVSIVYGDVREELRVFARMTGLEVLELTGGQGTDQSA